MKWEIGLLNKLFKTFFITKEEKKLKNFLTRNKNNLEADLKVLVQNVEDIYYYCLFGTIVSSLDAKRNIKVDQYVQRNLTLGSSSSISSFVKSIVLNNRFRDNKWINLYNSYCEGIAYRHEGTTTLFYNISAFIKAYKMFKNIKSKDELLSLIIEDINVGELIYDSYLRYKPSATVEINDFYLCIIIWQTIRNIKVTKDYFNNHKPDILLISYSTYIQHGITARVAVTHDTEVYSFGNYQSFTKQLFSDDIYHTANYKNYKNDFEKLKNKNQFLVQSEKELRARLNGKKDTATSYMKQSAYKSLVIDIPDVNDSIIVFMHDFFDSPHVYGSMIFNDFLEWIEFTITILKKYNIPFYLKPHPNQIEDSKKVIEGLKVKYPDVKFISSSITNKQLVDGNIKIGISVYGTVAHELTYMGIPVILSSENPHSSYSFCFEAKTKKEYENYIKNYATLTLPADYKEEVESFYYMHNLNKNENELELIKLTNKLRNMNNLNTENSVKKIKEEVNKIYSNNAFKTFINSVGKGDIK